MSQFTTFLKRATDFDRLADALAGPRATSFRVGVGVVFLLSLGTVFTDRQQSLDSRQLWTALAFESFLVSAGFYVAFALMLQRLKLRSLVARVVSVAVLYTSTEMVRAVFVGVTSVAWGLRPEVYWAYRLTAGGLTGLALMTIGALIMNDAVEYVTAKGALQSALAQEQAVADANEAEIVNQRRMILRSAQDAVIEALKGALDRPRRAGDRDDEIVRELLKISDEVVRPLSHRLFVDVHDSVSIPSSTLPERVSWRRAWQLSTYAQPFNAFGVTALGFFLLVGTALFGPTSPITGFLALALAEIWLYVSLSALSRFLVPIMRRLAALQRSACFVAATFAVSTPIIVYLSFAGGLSPSSSWAFVFYSYVLVAVVSWSFALYLGILHARQEILAEHELALERLSWAKARLGAELAREQRHVATVLHKDVQGSVVAGALMIQNALDAGEPIGETLSRVRSLLMESVNFDLQESDAPSLVEFLSEINDSWNGIITLSLQMSPEADERLNRDEVCRRCVQDFLAEFTTNSVKHGRARNGHVELEVEGERVLQLRFTNNGVPLANDAAAGLGMQLARQQSILTTTRNLPAGGIEIISQLALA